MLWYVIFWTVFGSLAFAFALAWQMRVIIGVIIARALRARDEELPIKASRLAVVQAGNDEEGSPEVDHILETWPAQMRQLKLARKVSVIMPVLILALMVFGRFMGRI